MKACTQNRHWCVDVLEADEIREQARDAAQEIRTQRQQEQLEHDKAEVAKVLVKHRDGETKTAIRDESGLSSLRFNAALAALIGKGDAERVEVTKGNNRTYEGYKPASRGDQLVATGRNRTPQQDRLSRCQSHQEQDSAL
jgi:hypothetical protein